MWIPMPGRARNRSASSASLSTGTVPSIRICCSSSDIPSRHTSTGRYAAAWVFTHLRKVTQSHSTDPIPERIRAAGRRNGGIPPCLSSSRGRDRRVGRGGSQASHNHVPVPEACLTSSEVAQRVLRRDPSPRRVLAAFSCCGGHHDGIGVFPHGHGPPWHIRGHADRQCRPGVLADCPYGAPVRRQRGRVSESPGSVVCGGLPDVRPPAGNRRACTRGQCNGRVGDGGTAPSWLPGR